MPTCEPCGTFYNPNSLTADGTCPECGARVSSGDLAPAAAMAEHPSQGSGQVARDVDHELERTVPWHFWVGVIAVTLYLGWRLVQGVSLLF